jgi:DNA-directed RNA polymerase beta subunit
MSFIENQVNIMSNKQSENIDSKTSSPSIASFFGGKTESELENIIPNVNDLTTDDLFRVADLHFYKKNYIFRHLPNSYNKFIEEDVKNYLEYEEHVFTENVTESTVYKYRFKFENIRIQEPMLNNNIEPLFPSMARHQNLTYSLKIFADVTQYQDIIDISSDKKDTNMIGTQEKNILVAIIPLMVRSKWCSLTIHKGVDKNECDYDPGC